MEELKLSQAMLVLARLGGRHSAAWQRLAQQEAQREQQGDAHVR